MSQGQGNITYSSPTDLNAKPSGPGPPDSAVQFNNSGAFGGSVNLTWNNATRQFQVVGSIAMPLADAGLTQGYISIGGFPFLSGYDNSGSSPGHETNVFIGTGTGNLVPANVGQGNVGIGFAAMQNMTTGIGNTAIGITAGQGITTGDFNTAIGEQALRSCTTGNNNIVVGASGASISIGSGNTIMGSQVADNLIDGNNNVIIGALGGSNFIHANNCVFLGYELGQGGADPADGTLLIGSTVAVPTLIYGEMLNPGYVEIRGHLGVTFNNLGFARNDSFALDLGGPILIHSFPLGAVTNGALEYDGTNLFFTTGGVRHTIV